MKLVRAGNMPGRHVILLGSDNEELRVPYESIEIVDVGPSKSGAFTGFLIGAAVDITALILLVSAERSTEADCNRSASGCGNQTCALSKR
jgi:hypothetical protein